MVREQDLSGKTNDGTYRREACDVRQRDELAGHSRVPDDVFPVEGGSVGGQGALASLQKPGDRSVGTYACWETLLSLQIYWDSTFSDIKIP